MDKNYLIAVVVLLVLWGGFNFYNYTTNQQVAQASIQENIEFIDDVVDEISTKQQSLRLVQRTLVDVSNNHKMASIPSPSPSTSDVSPPTITDLEVLSDNPMVDELQSRIDELEKEKMEYKNEKSIIITEILDVVKLMKWDIGNPLINIVMLPLLLYIGKKILDILFKIFDKKLFT